MGLDRWSRVRDVFERAVEVDPREREHFVERECSDDPLVSREVRRLLSNWTDDSNFLTPPGGTVLTERIGVIAMPEGGEVAGRYRIERLLGAGGMGSVYLAHQERPSRAVALKLMRPSADTEAMQRRFAAEAEILGRLRHPAIAVIHESGIHDGLHGPTPYFAMEYVEGARDLATFAKDEALDVRQRVVLVRTVCEAVQHAHGKGVIHRDLKPGNLLVDANGTLKVIDFGVARVVGPDLALSIGTVGGAALGTISYASPEQLQGDWRDVDVRTDVYSIGVTLFELLVGRAPFVAGERALAEVVREVCEKPAPAPSSLAPDVPRELDWIVLRCLEKERDRRYATADELARDLGRWMDGEPVLAAPQSATYRLRKFVARNRFAVAATGIVFASLVTAVVVSWRETREADRQRNLATLASEASARDAQAAREALAEAERQRGIAVAASEQSERDAEVARIASRRQSAIVDSLRSMLGAVSPDEDGRNVTLFELLERRRTKLDEEFADDPTLRVAVQQFLLEAYANLGLQEQGMLVAESALATMEREGGYSASELSAMQFYVARRYFEQGRVEEAEPLVERAHRLAMTSQGTVSEDAVAALHMRAMLMEKRGETEASIEAMTEALELARESLGDDHLATMMLMTDVALGHALQRRIDEAVALAKEGRERARRVLPRGHSMLPLFDMRLGSVLTAAGRGAEAIELQRENVATVQELYGEHHRNTAQAQREFASSLLSARRYEEALAESERALELVRTHHPKDIELELLVLGTYGGALDGLRRYEDSAQVWRSCVEMFEATGRRADNSTMQARIGLGSALLQLGEYADAEESLRETLDIANEALPPDDLMVGFTRFVLAQAIAQQDRLAEGYGEMRAAWENLSQHTHAGAVRRAHEALGMLAQAAEKLGLDEDHVRWRALHDERQP